MSIATQITRINTAKADIKEEVNQDFEKIQDETITYYPEKIAETIEEYKKYIPEKSYSGTEINVDDAAPIKGKIAVKGNTYQKQLSGKNLFGISDYEKTYNGVQIKIKDGEITLNGTCTGTGTVYIRPKDEQILNGTYTISRNSISGTMSGSGNINLRNVSDDSIISGTQMSLTINSRTFTLENANVEYGIYLMRDATFDNYKFRPQLVEGDTPDYDFEPYCGGQPSPNPDYPQEIKVVTGNNTIKHYGKNILNCLLFENNDYVNIVEKSIGKLKLSGHNSFYVGITLRLNLKPNTNYSFRAKVTELGTKAQGKLFIVNQNYNLNGLIVLENRIATSSAITQPGELTASFTTDSTGIIGLLLQVNNATNSSTITYDNIQLEEGSATEYEPHKENAYQLNLGNIELCKIGDYEDVLFKNVVGDENYNAELESGAWYKKKVFDKEILDNNTVINSVAQSTGNPDYTYVYSNILDNKVKLNANTLFMCDCFRTHTGKMIKSTQVNTDSINISNSDNNMLLRFMILTSRLTEQTNAAVKVFFNSIKPVLYYELREPVYEKITDTTLISQLEALNKFKWFKGVNHIWTETENLEPVLEGKYKAVVESEVS